MLLNLTDEQITIIVECLFEAPAKISHGVLIEIKKQVDALSQPEIIKED